MEEQEQRVGIIAQLGALLYLELPVMQAVMVDSAVVVAAVLVVMLGVAVTVTPVLTVLLVMAAPVVEVLAALAILLLVVAAVE